MSKIKDLTNKRFGRLVVQSRAENSSNGNSRWNCQCDCGKTTIAVGSHLLYGQVTSCGCKRYENLSRGLKTHGKSRTPEYKIYTGAKGRCENSNNKNFHQYGGRGIKFKFRNFEEFFKELGTRPSSKYTLDRIDNDGNYERGNVRWTTQTQQIINRRIHNKTGFKGVRQIKNRYQTVLNKGNHKIYLGTYATAVEAAIVFDRHHFNLHHNSSALNFPYGL